MVMHIQLQLDTEYVTRHERSISQGNPDIHGSSFMFNVFERICYHCT